MKIFRKKLMFYVRDELTPKVCFWALRFSEKPSFFVNSCVWDALRYAEIGPLGDPDPAAFEANRVTQWLWLQGKPVETKLPRSTVERLRAEHADHFQKSENAAAAALETFQSGTKPKPLYLQIRESEADNTETAKDVNPQTSPTGQVRLIAQTLGITPNHLINEIIVGSICGLEQSDIQFVAPIMREYRLQYVVTRHNRIEGERQEAERFDVYSGLPSELITNGWAMTFLSEVSQDHKQKIASALKSGLPETDGLRLIYQEERWAKASKYLDRLRCIYHDPEFVNLANEHPLQERKLWKAIIDALAEYWLNNKNQANVQQSRVERIEHELLNLASDDLKRLSRTALSLARKNKAPTI